MVRRLPWKNGTSAKLPKGKERARITADRGSLDDSEQDSADEDESQKEDADSSDNENYRITESEFVDTARYFTREIHQKAYEKLLQQQQKEIESQNTLSDLLEQPVPLSAVVSMPPTRIAESKAKSADSPLHIKSDLQAGPSKSLNLPSMILSEASHDEQHKGSSSEVNSETLPTDTAKSTSEPKQGAVTKLSDAAAARRRKRQEAQNASAAMSPFW